MRGVSSCDAFKLGFIQCCTENGMSPEQACVHMNKTAINLEKKGSMQDIYDYILTNMQNKPTAGQVGPPSINIPKAMLLATGGLGAAAGLGALGGHLARSLQGDHLDEDDVHKQELINEANLLASRAKHSGSAALGL